MADKRSVVIRTFALLLAAALLPGGAALAAEPEETPSVAAIYTTGDMRGRIYSKDPLTGQSQASSYLKVSSAMAREREEMDGTLLLDSGNAVYTGLTGEDGQTVARVLRAVGYDALVPGVEEFRLGSGYRSQLFQTLEEAEGDGTPVDVLSANLLDGAGKENLTAPYQVYALPLGDTQVRVGVLGLSGMDIAQQLPQRLYGDVSFVHPDNEAETYTWEWEYWQGQLEEDCDLTVVVCQADRDTLTQFAAQTTGIDLLVGSGTDAGADSIQNKEGEWISYVCGGGSALTRTLVTVDEEGNPILGESALLRLEDYEENETLARLTTSSYTAAERAAGQRVATLSGAWDGSRAAARQTDTGDLVGEALLWATGADAALISPASFGEVTPAALFEKKSSTAALTLGDCAKILPDPSPVVTVELTGAQLRQWLDTCAQWYTVTDAGQPAGGTEADFLYGMSYELYLGSSTGKRVNFFTVDGLPVQDEQIFTVAVSAARLSDPEFPECTVTWSAAADKNYASQGGSAAALLAAYARNATSESRTLTHTQSSTWAVYAGAYNASLTRLEFVEMLYELAGRPQPGANVAFIDVERSNAVVWAAETGVVSGDGRGNFLPLTVVTREQAAVMIYNYVRSLGVEAPRTSEVDELLDAPAISPWARPAVEFCLAEEILPATGVREDLYLPDTPITRMDATFYLAALADYLEDM